VKQRLAAREQRLLEVAESGDPGAQFNLGIVYDSRTDCNGHPVAGHRDDALLWLLRAARQGFSRAQIKLAELYEERPKPAANCQHAAYWFRVATLTSTGAYQQAALSGYERMLVHLSGGQIAKLDRRVQAWAPTPESKIASRPTEPAATQALTATT
jgi:TPR repeat protein